MVGPGGGNKPGVGSLLETGSYSSCLVKLTMRIIGQLLGGREPQAGRNRKVLNAGER